MPADVNPDDDRLAAVLASVGEQLLVDTPGPAPSVASGRGPWRPLLVAAATLAIVAGTVTALGPARRAVGGWFGAGRIEVELDRGADLDGLPAFTAPARRIAPVDAAEVLGAEVPPVDGSALGPPTGWWTLPEGGVLVDWGDGDVSLWIVRTPGENWVVQKTAVAAADVTRLPELGDGGVAVSGDHLVATPYRRTRAESVVAWADGDLSFRLEGGGGVGEMVDVAEQLAGGCCRERATTVAP